MIKKERIGLDIDQLSGIALLFNMIIFILTFIFSYLLIL